MLTAIYIKLIELKKKQLGFTLIEILIATVIFAFLITAAVSAFTNVYSQQYHITARRRLQEDTRQVMEKMVNELRNGTIDYAMYHIKNNQLSSYSEYETLAPDYNDQNSIKGSGDGYEEILYILSLDGETHTTFALSEGKLTVLEELYNPTVPICATTEFLGWCADELKYPNHIPRIISPDTLYIQSLKFIISPKKDPHHFYRIQDIQYQPNVVLELTACSLPQNPPAPFTCSTDETLTLQTTASSRAYGKISWNYPLYDLALE